jgi:hypothetical protein
MRYDNGGTLKKYFVQISQTLQNKGLSRSYQCPRGLRTLFSLSVSVSGKYGCCPGQTWGVGQEGQGLAMGINEHKILRNEVIDETGVPVALAGTFMT